RGSRRAFPCPWRLRTGPRRRRGRSPPSLGPLLLTRLGGAVPAERAEVDLLQRLVDQALLILVVERLAGHLLGRQHGQVGDLPADPLQRAPGLRLDVAPSGREQLPALLAALPV